MKNYAEALGKIGKRDRCKLANNTYLNRRPEGLAVTLHSTDVVLYTPSGCFLSSGGWRTVTTKARINDFSPAYVTQAKGVWYVSGVPFADGMKVCNDGSIEGGGVADLDLKKRLNAYAKAYAKAWAAGAVPAPSAGDCFFCAMVDTKTGKPIEGNSHLEMHLEESYFVPAMVRNAYEEFGGCFSPLSGSGLGLWSTGQEIPEYVKAHTAERIRKGIQKYLNRAFGFAM